VKARKANEEISVLERGPFNKHEGRSIKWGLVIVTSRGALGSGEERKGMRGVRPT